MTQAPACCEPGPGSDPERLSGAQAAFTTLVKRGAQALDELARNSGVPRPTVKRALLVLMQHKCVACYLLTEDAVQRRDAPVARYLYEADMERTLQNLRWAAEHNRSSATTFVVEGFCDTLYHSVHLWSLLLQSQQQSDLLHCQQKHAEWRWFRGRCWQAVRTRG